MRGDNVDDAMAIPLDLNGGVPFFPEFKPSHDEFDTCNRYDLIYESPEYDPTITSYSKQEAAMTDSWGQLKVPGDSHPRWRKACSLRKKELEVKQLGVSYSYTSAKLQDL
jgi:hypothetical protein